MEAGLTRKIFEQGRVVPSSSTGDRDQDLEQKALLSDPSVQNTSLLLGPQP